eukprot:g1597.t1
MARRPVEMIRIPQEDADDVLDTDSRDVASVFPTEVRSSEVDEVQRIEDAVKTRFISETELQESRESDQWVNYGRQEDAGKSLAEILAENKKRKDDEFQEQWKAMKQGKNRPLDTEDFEFVDSVFQEEAKKTKEQFAQREQDIEEFRKAREEILTTTATTTIQQKPVESKPNKPVKKPRLTGLKSKPKVKVVPKKRTASSSSLEKEKKWKVDSVKKDD